MTEPTNCSIWGLVTRPMSLDSALWDSAQGNVLPGKGLSQGPMVFMVLKNCQLIVSY